VDKKGAKGPIFEGNMLPQKKYPFSGPVNGAIAWKLLREDPLSPGIWGMFFENIVPCVSFSKREFIYLKLLKFPTVSTRMIRIEAGSSIP
jgi:hypothetical protein